VWSRLGSGPQGTIYASAVFDDGNGPALYVGGDWHFVDGVGMVGIARWNGSAWDQPLDVPAGNIYSMAVYDDGSGRALYIGGNFTNVVPLGPRTTS
jgi:hypothetical protein